MSTLMTEYALHGRDFLAIHPGTHRTTPCILARERAILVNLNSIRGIITDESMIIFNVHYTLRWLINVLDRQSLCLENLS